ncbi:aquaporin family protein [Flagellimonas taeanensis]|uniref:MIP/aquaporin family protein n=1 Tax=Flavobacteriaceae TaxID=49546 RepID=UPI000E69D4CC|nr:MULTISPECIES: MIP/aquaporin family protein [Allomuricauda]MDC6385065.1 aquaporin family protein [Muricauda sp. SK9]RIV48968.1 aquaporin family protein [Allomuricauda taeanensis]
MTPFVAEIVGTFLLMLMGCGVNANVSLQKTYGNGSGWIVITTGWAFAVYTGVVVAGPHSGAHLNPAVTIGLAVAGEFPVQSIASYILAQFIGAMLGAFAVWLMNKDHFDATEDGNTKRGVFCNAPAIPNMPLNLLTEILGTFVLVFAVLYFTDAMLSTDNAIIGLGSLGALPVALIVWGIGLSLGGTTGYAINPARDMGPRIVHALVPIKNKGSNGWGYSWIPVVGPILGAVLAAGIALLLQ